MNNLHKYNQRSDLIIDIFNNIKDNNLKIKKRKINNIEILDIEVLNDNNNLNKNKGKYITISFNTLDNKLNIEKITVRELKKLFTYLKIKKNNKCLVIGLGNRYVTPDSLGPKTVDNILVTKYLYDIKGIKINKRFRNVSAFTPDVKGNTGIETKDIILGLIKQTKPDFLIIIDALASSSINRINKTIQITTAGINPGSGIYNVNNELNYKELGIPIISLGIPTVIDASVLLTDTFNCLEEYFTKRKKDYLKEFKKLDNNKKQNLIYKALEKKDYNMIVTSKDIDFIIEKASILLSNVINKSLHQNFDI